MKQNQDYSEAGRKFLRYVDGVATSSCGRPQVYRDIFEKDFGKTELSDERWALLAHLWLGGMILDDEIDKTVARLLVGDTKAEA